MGLGVDLETGRPIADVKLMEMQSETAWPRRTSSLDIVPDMSPDAEADLQAGYWLPPHMGLELSISTRGSAGGPVLDAVPAVTLCDDFMALSLVECVGVDMLPSKGDVSLNRPASAGLYQYCTTMQGWLRKLGALVCGWGICDFGVPSICEVHLRPRGF